MNPRDIRRKLGMGMVSGDHYDISDSASEITANGTFVCPVGETMFGFKNEFGVPVRLFLRAGRIQTYTPIYPSVG